MGDHHQKVQKVPEDQREDVNQEVQSHTQNLVKLKKKTQILLKKLQHKKENIQKEQNIQKVLTIHTPKVVNIHMENMEENIILEKSLVHIILEKKSGPHHPRGKAAHPHKKQKGHKKMFKGKHGKHK